MPRSDGAPCGCVARVEALLREAEAYRSECDATAKAHFAKSERERDEDDEVTDQQVDARAAVQAYKNAVAALTATEERGASAPPPLNVEPGQQWRKFDDDVHTVERVWYAEHGPREADLVEFDDGTKYKRGLFDGKTFSLVAGVPDAAGEGEGR